MAEEATRTVPGLVAVGLLATTATARAQLYHRAFGRRGVRVIVPEGEDQRAVDRAIYSVKAGDLGPEVRKAVAQVGVRLVERGAGAIVLGCTEIPLVVDPEMWPVPVLDSTRILAQVTVRTAVFGLGNGPGVVGRLQEGP